MVLLWAKLGVDIHNKYMHLCRYRCLCELLTFVLAEGIRGSSNILLFKLGICLAEGQELSRLLLLLPPLVTHVKPIVHTFSPGQLLARPLSRGYVAYECSFSFLDEGCKIQ